MATGIVKWFNATKGFGLTEPDVGKFVHISAVVKVRLSNLNEGFSFDVVANRGRESAENLRVG